MFFNYFNKLPDLISLCPSTFILEVQYLLYSISKIDSMAPSSFSGLKAEDSAIWHTLMNLIFFGWAVLDRSRELLAVEAADSPPTRLIVLSFEQSDSNPAVSITHRPSRIVHAAAGPCKRCMAGPGQSGMALHLFQLILRCSRSIITPPALPPAPLPLPSQRSGHLFPAPFS